MFPMKAFKVQIPPLSTIELLKNKDKAVDNTPYMSVNVQGDVNISIDKDKGRNGMADTASDKVSFWANIVQIVSGLCGIIKEHKAIAAVICVIWGTAGCAGINVLETCI